VAGVEVVRQGDGREHLACDKRIRRSGIAAAEAPVQAVPAEGGLDGAGALQQVHRADGAGIGRNGGGRCTRSVEKAKTPLPGLRRVDGAVDGNTLGLARLLVAEEEKGMVLDDGAANASSELIANQRRALHPCGVVEELVGVEDRVAVEVEKRAVILVAARTSD